METTELYCQEIEAGNCLDFQVEDESISLFIKNIAIIPTEKGDSDVICYTLINNQKTILCRLHEIYSPNVQCLYPVVQDGNVKMKLYFEGKGRVNLIGYSIMTVFDENDEC